MNMYHQPYVFQALLNKPGLIFNNVCEYGINYQGANKKNMTNECRLLDSLNRKFGVNLLCVLCFIGI